MDRDRLIRTFDRCSRAIDKLAAIHRRQVQTELAAYLIGRRIMRIVRRLKAKARQAHAMAIQLGQ